jgi:hypothetical protein
LIEIELDESCLIGVLGTGMRDARDVADTFRSVLSAFRVDLSV